MHDRITVRMTAEMIARIDSWIAAQPGYISRQEAMRRFVEFALERLDQVSRPEDDLDGPYFPATGPALPSGRHNPDT
jgi:Arc/MetJ-type ribon-helix-helix transcriptional regulator